MNLNPEDADYLLKDLKSKLSDMDSLLKEEDIRQKNLLKQAQDRRNRKRSNLQLQTSSLNLQKRDLESELHIIDIE